MKIPILMYHLIAAVERTDRYTVSAREFERQMFSLRDMGYQVISLDEAIRNLAKPEPSINSVCVTFDDGFHDTFVCAAPVIEKLRYPATFFLLSGLMGGTNTWLSETDAKSRHRLLGWSEAKDLLKAGFEIGSHTVSHPVLTQISPARAVEEIGKSKRVLEAKLEGPVRYFAYPYGQFDDRIRDMVQSAGYEAACSTLSGFANEDNDLYALRRIEIFGGDSLRVFRRKLKFGANEMSSFDVARYYARRVLAR